MGVEVDQNKNTGRPKMDIFLVMEIIFCILFTGEILIRFVR